MPQKPVNIYDTAMAVRVKRFDKTFFILCDEYETVGILKGRMLSILNQIGFEMPKQEEPMTVDDIRFTVKNRILDPESTCHD